jgi:hypothetical protein
MRGPGHGGDTCRGGRGRGGGGPADNQGPAAAARSQATRSGLCCSSSELGEMGAPTGGLGATVPWFDLIQARSNPFKRFKQF